MEYIIYIFVIVGGFIAGYFVQKNRLTTKQKNSETKAEKIVHDAKLKQKEILLKAQDKALKIINDAKKEEEVKRERIDSLQAKLQHREDVFSEKLLDLQDKQQKLYNKVNKVDKIKKEIKKLKNKQLEKLNKISEMSKDEARDVLFKNIEVEAKEDIMIRVKKLENIADDKINEVAKGFIAVAMQRVVSSYVPMISVSSIDLPNDEMKGRIIGREGRNIRSIEQATGVEIIVDDTPNLITISAFSPIRRHVAKKALVTLIKDGRIQPAKIEDAVETAKKEVAMDIKKAGEDAMYKVGVTGFNPKLVQIIGRLKYRSSYGQSVWQHSIEVAHLSALLAEELNVDVTLAKKAGLLHDIGKAVDHEVQGTHPDIGASIGKKFGLRQEIIDAIQTHHDDHPKGILSVIVKVADAISASKPGARSDSYERYMQRLEELEAVASCFKGVEKVYAIQAGREIRVFVNAEQIDDLETHKLARNIAKKIEEELKYPGEIKVNIIRETRIIEYAR